jgi:hypothetical protein
MSPKIKQELLGTADELDHPVFGDVTPAWQLKS